MTYAFAFFQDAVTLSSSEFSSFQTTIKQVVVAGPDFSLVSLSLLRFSDLTTTVQTLCSARANSHMSGASKADGMKLRRDEFSETVLEVRRSVVREDRPDTLGNRHDIARALLQQGRWRKAEEMCREVLEARRKILGEDHPDTLSSKTSLASALCELGRWAEAEEMYREVLGARRRIVGEDHPETLVSKNDLASSLYQQARWQEAEEMYRELLDAKRKVLGEEHPDTLAIRCNLATVLSTQGHWPESVEMHREVLEEMTRVRGADHPDTLVCRNNLARTLQAKGDWQEAEARLGQVLDVRREVLGEDHPDTLRSLHNLAVVVAERDQHDWSFRCSLTGSSHADRLVDAVSKLRTVVRSWQPQVDDDHFSLLLCRFALAKLLVQMNQEENVPEVEKMLQHLVPQLRERYGLQNSRTQEATRDLVFVLEEQSKDAEEWRQLLLAKEDPNDTTLLSAEQESLEKFLGEKWVGTDELLRGLLGKEYPLCRGEICKAASSNATSSSAQPCEMPTTESSASASSSDISLDSLELLQAALQVKIQERKEREGE